MTDGYQQSSLSILTLASASEFRSLSRIYQGIVMVLFEAWDRIDDLSWIGSHFSTALFLFVIYSCCFMEAEHSTAEQYSPLGYFIGLGGCVVDLVLVLQRSCMDRLRSLGGEGLWMWSGYLPHNFLSLAIFIP